MGKKGETSWAEGLEAFALLCSLFASALLRLGLLGQVEEELRSHKARWELRSFGAARFCVKEPFLRGVGVASPT